jgi:hypothetical protein
MENIIFQGPTFREYLPQNMNFAVGQSAQLKCIVFGMPYPSVRWFYNGKEIKRDK